jgi:hypothetical protein
MRSTWIAAMSLAAVAPASAQICGSSYVPSQSTGLTPFSANRLVFPTGVPFNALEPASAGNPLGYPPAANNHWPVGVTVGDIDNDGDIDMLFQIEQRLLLAVTFTRSSCGLPIAAVPMWAIFEPQGRVNKRLWGSDKAAIFDIDGDGLNEVAWVGRRNNDDFVVQVIDDNPTLTPDAAFGGIGRPNVAATWSINANDSGWAGRIGIGQMLLVSVCRHGSASQYDLIVTSSESAEPHILRFTPGASSLSLLYSHPWAGANTHYPHVFDIDNDGYDEILANGVLDPSPGAANWRLCSYYYSPDSWTCPANSGPHDHADDILPIGLIDGDQVQDLLIVDDYFTKIASGAASGTVVPMLFGTGISVNFPMLLRHNTLAPVIHGQGALIGKFLAGADTFNVDGPQILMTPKGAPIYNGSGPGWGSYVANKNLDTLALGVTNPAANGFLVAPTGWRPHTMDWDGDRTTDEVFNPFGDINAIFRLEAAPAGSQHPYRWRRDVEVALWAHPESFNMFASLACDMFGDPREEALCISPRSIVFLHNPAPEPFPGRFKSPWNDVEYRRRHNSIVRRNVNYQALPTLQRVEIRPATLAVAPGGAQPLTAIGVYSDGSTEDVTAFASWTSGNTTAATVSSGGVLNGVTSGVANVRATVAGVASNSPCVAVVTTSSTPRIVYAGWANTHLVAGQPSTLTVEAAIADLQDDVLAVALTAGSATLSLAFVDNGTNGDRVANDNIWTLQMPNTNLPTPSDAYFEVIAIDLPLNFSARWPYVQVAGGSATPIPGVPLFPFVSESFGQPIVRIAGMGVLDSNLTGGGGTLTLCARVDDPRLQTIFVFHAGADTANNLNDSGLSGDQIAGDGLWTRTLTLPSGFLPGGESLFEMVGFSALPGGGPVSDAHPRLRVH